MSAVLRAPALKYRKTAHQSELTFESVPLRELAERFGTPLYAYSAQTLRARLAAMEHAFRKVPHTMCYSVKANSNLSLLRLIAKSGAGFDVVSGGELERVRRVAPQAHARVVFSGVGKTAEELEAALRAKILLFNIESDAELQLLGELAAQRKVEARVAVRVNPDIPARTHPYISTGLRAHKFGVPIAQARKLYHIAAKHPWLEPAGLSLHIGSQIREMRPFSAAVGRALELVRTLREDGIAIQYLDCGGGLGIPYQRAAQDFASEAERYAAAVTAPLRGSGLHLLLEPGRWIVGPAGLLLTRVLLLKENGRKTFAVCDAAMNDLIRPALYGAYHEIAPVKLAKTSMRRCYDVVGPICETGDFFARGRMLPELQAGELLAVLDAGAYGMSLSSNYNSRPRAAEVLVEGPKARLIRRRESIDELLRAES